MVVKPETGTVVKSLTFIVWFKLKESVNICDKVKPLCCTIAGKEAPKSKEAAVLRDSSLSFLAREVAPEKTAALCFLMYLNIPTARIIDLICDIENGFLSCDDAKKTSLLLTGLIRWKEMKCGCKEREKVKEMDRALRELGKTEIADVFMERHGNQTELTSDAFASLG